jgi:hypothetical protein
MATSFKILNPQQAEELILREFKLSDQEKLILNEFKISLSERFSQVPEDFNSKQCLQSWKNFVQERLLVYNTRVKTITSKDK